MRKVHKQFYGQKKKKFKLLCEQLTSEHVFRD